MPDKSAEVESELDSSEELSGGNYLSNARSKSPHMKFNNTKNGIPKTVKVALAFKKQQQKFHILTRRKHADAVEGVEGPSDVNALELSRDENDVETTKKRTNYV